ncbi:MAG: FadR family transcriptional regulator [Actinobacteria bacterium]|nr:FadR family transcriptional regulator [Actinomycetota bacterium]
MFEFFLHPIRSGNTFEEVINRIMEAIRLGLLRPGDRLPAERDLASHFGVSRATVRQAIGSLHQAGHVEARRGRGGGTFIVDAPSVASRRSTGRTKCDPADLDDAIEMRRLLEVGAVELAAARKLTEVEAADLRAASESCAAGGLRDYRPFDSHFHLVIAGLAGVPSLVPAVATVRSRVNDLLDAIPLLPPNIEHSNRQHDELVTAILAGDPLGAKHMMSEHLLATATLLRAFL